MKKINLLLFFVILCVSIICIFMFINKNDIIDYSEYNDNIVFYQDFSDLVISGNYQVFYENINSLNSIKIICLDEKFNPLENVVFEFYDEDGYLILEERTNDLGIIGINGIEDDTVYYFKQVSSLDNYIIDDTMYKMNVSNSENFTQVVINSKKKLKDSKIKSLIKKYNKKYNKEHNLDSDYISVLSDKQRNEFEIINKTEYDYKFLIDDLKGLNLSLVSEGESGNDSYYTKYVLRIENAYVMEYEVECSDDTISLMNKDKEVTDKFYNGEEFYVVTDDYIDDDTNFKFTIKFKYNDKIYLVSKNTSLSLDYNNSTIGQINVLVRDFDSNSKICLYSYDNKDSIGCLSTSGVIHFYKVPVGGYVLSKIKDGEEVYSDVFDVNVGKITGITF